MTALVPQVPASALDGAADLATVMKALADRKAIAAPEKADVTPLVVPVTQKAKDAIARLNKELATTELPSTRRALTVTEQKKLLALASDAKLTKKATEDAVAAVKTAVFNHFDVGLESDNQAETLAAVQDEKGHYLVENSLEVPDSGMQFVRQLSQGSPTVTAAGLKKLWDEGKISRADYYAATRKPDVPRVVDEEGLLDRLKNKPELLEAIAEIVVPGTVTASFWVKPVKDR